MPVVAHPSLSGLSLPPHHTDDALRHCGDSATERPRYILCSLLLFVVVVIGGGVGVVVAAVVHVVCFCSASRISCGCGRVYGCFRWRY